MDLFGWLVKLFDPSIEQEYYTELARLNDCKARLWAIKLRAYNEAYSVSVSLRTKIHNTLVKLGEDF